MDQAPDSRESALLTEASGNSASVQQVVEVVARQLESMLSVGNYDGVKLLLAPVQPVDVAEAIGSGVDVLARLGVLSQEAPPLHPFRNRAASHEDRLRHQVDCAEQFGVSLSRLVTVRPRHVIRIVDDQRDTGATIIQPVLSAYHRPAMIRENAYNRVLLEFVGFKLLQNGSDLPIEPVHAREISGPVIPGNRMIGVIGRDSDLLFRDVLGRSESPVGRPGMDLSKERLAID